MVDFILHIPKTGGTYFSDILSKVPIKLFVSRTGTEYQRFLDSYSDDMVVMGHHIMNFHKEGSSYRYFTIIREPIQRAISEYHYIRTEKTHHLHKKSIELGIVNFNKKCRTDNIQSRLIIGDKDKPGEPYLGELTLDMALFHLNKFNYIGLFDYFEESVRTILDRIGINVDHTFESHVTFAEQRIKTFSESKIESIRRTCLIDIQLYEHICKTFIK